MISIIQNLTQANSCIVARETSFGTDKPSIGISKSVGMCRRLNFQFEINQTSKIVSQIRICINDCVVQFSEITKE